MKSPRVAIYARVSTALKLGLQDPANQVIPLHEFIDRRGWTLAAVYIEDMSAVAKHRPQFQNMLAAARRGEIDIILVVRLDRIFRSMTEFVVTLKSLEKWGVRFVCSEQNIDTDRADPAGALLMQIVAAVAEFERSLISERVKAGLARAKLQGKKLGGGHRKSIDIEEAIKARNEGWTIARIAGSMGVHRTLVSRALKRYQDSDLHR